MVKEEEGGEEGVGDEEDKISFPGHPNVATYGVHGKFVCARQLVLLGEKGDLEAGPVAPHHVARIKTALQQNNKKLWVIYNLTLL